MTDLNLFSNFNLGVLSGILNNKLRDLDCRILENSMVGLESLHHSVLKKSDEEENIGFLWFSPESISPSFNLALTNRPHSNKKILEEFTLFFNLIKMSRDKFSRIILPSFHTISLERGHGILDLRKNLGIRNLLDVINMEMINFFDKDDDVFILDHHNWISGGDSYYPRMWFSAKVPFHNKVFDLAALDIKTILRASRGLTKKLLVLDLDNTLWGGVVGDDGWQNLRLGGHDQIGEAFSDFQKKINSLSKKGVILAICSKNTESVALEAISKNPEMILKEGDFSAFRINWDDKASNIKSICKELDLGTDSAVFLDDNINERERVKSSLPEVTVPDLPKDPRLYSNFLSELSFFDSYSFTKEDRSRKDLYKQRKAQKESLESIDSLQSVEEWLSTLNIVMTAEILNETNITRVVQLLNKTNQMNLTTRRLNRDELLSWNQSDSNFMWSFKVSDKFGDAGLTGIVSFSLQDSRAQIIDFILSCRVMGKQIEHSMLYLLIKEAKSMGAKEVFAKFKHTEKNKPCHDFWKSTEFIESRQDYFSFDLVKEFVPSQVVKINEIN